MPARSPLRLVLAAGACALSLLCARPAAAYHTKEQRITDESAYTLRRNDFRFGLWKAQYGIIDSVTAGTYIWPWAFRVSNLHAKWRYWRNDTWALSVFAALFHLDTKSFQQLEDDTGNATITVFPFELAASYRFDDRYTLSVAPIWTTVVIKGNLADDDLKGAGEGAVNNFQLTATFEWRVSRVTALLFHGRYLVAQTAHAQGDVVLRPDEFTTIEVHAAGQTDEINFRRAGSLTVSSVFSWDTFNFRFGLSLGNYNVPGVNFVIGDPLVIPELDLYWIF
jgi:hypothetical protein